MDELTKALRKAAAELVDEHGWDLGATGADELVDLLRKHVLPLTDPAAWRSLKIAALRADLAAYEAEPESPEDQ